MVGAGGDRERRRGVREGRSPLTGYIYDQSLQHQSTDNCQWFCCMCHYSHCNHILEEKEEEEEEEEEEERRRREGEGRRKEEEEESEEEEEEEEERRREGEGRRKEAEEEERRRRVRVGHTQIGCHCTCTGVVVCRIAIIPVHTLFTVLS